LNLTTFLLTVAPTTTTSVPYFDNDFPISNQIVLPLVFGALGCFVRLLIVTIVPSKKNIKREKKKEILLQYSWIFILVGALAGFLVVNLINPKGTFSQVTTLSFIAGLSGITFLLRNSLVDGVIEENILNDVIDETITDVDEIALKYKSLGTNTPPEELVKILKEFYNGDTEPFISEDFDLDEEDDGHGNVMEPEIDSTSPEEEQQDTDKKEHYDIELPEDNGQAKQSEHDKDVTNDDQELPTNKEGGKNE
jgi:hypothetical protein